jgi:hypothetical protein
VKTGIVVFLFLFAILFSVRRRALILRMKQTNAQEMPFEPAPSPISRAILDLGGIAGGVYIAISALSAFLKLDIPARVTMGEVSFDPVAFVSLSSAIVWAVVQPVPKTVARRLAVRKSIRTAMPKT